MNNEKVTWKDRAYEVVLLTMFGFVILNTFGKLEVLTGFGVVYVIITLYDRLKK